MTARPDFDRWMRDSEWLIDTDPTVGSDAMRVRPEPIPDAPFRAVTSALRSNPFPVRPQPTRAPVERLTGEADELWIAIGQAYRNLADA